MESGLSGSAKGSAGTDDANATSSESFSHAILANQVFSSIEHGFFPRSSNGIARFAPESY